MPALSKAIGYLKRLLRDPRFLLLALPFVLLAPIWARGQALYWGTPSTQFIPWWTQAWTTINQGDLPLWNPMLGMGAPLLANYQSALLYPPTWIYFALFQIGGTATMAWGMAPMVAAHIALAGGGMLRLLRKLSFSIFAQIIGAIAFSLSGYLLARAHFLSINAAVAWLPWILLAIYRLVDKFEWKVLLSLTLMLAMQWLSGHAQTAWYSLLLGISWLLFWISRSKRGVSRWKSIAYFGVAVLFAISLAAIQLFPTFEYLLSSARSSQANIELAFTYSFWPWRLLTLIAPNLFGNPAFGNYWGYGNFWEDAIYIGLIPILLALGWLIKVRKVKERYALTLYLAGVIVVSLVWAMGKNLAIFPWLFKHVPSFDLFQAPTRVSLWMVFGLSLLAAMGADTWRRPKGRGLYWARLAIAGAAAILVVPVFVNWLGAAWQITILPTFVRSLIPLGALLLAFSLLHIFAPQNEQKTLGNWHWIAVAVLSVDLLWAGWGLNPGVGLDFYEDKPALAAIEAQLPPGQRLYISRNAEEKLKFQRFFRFDSFSTNEDAIQLRLSHLPNTSLLAGIPSANYFDPLLSTRFAKWIDLLEDAEGDQKTTMLQKMSLGLAADLPGENLEIETFTVEGLPRVRWVNCAQIVHTPEEAFLAIQAGDWGLDSLVVELAESKASEICGTSAGNPGVVEIIKESANELSIRVDAEGGGWLVVADSYFPGWKAEIDGRELAISPADLNFRAVHLPSGQYVVDFHYRPISFWVGAIVSLLGWTVWTFWIIKLRRRA